MSQLAINFHARRTDPATSHKAAATVGKFAGEHHRRIMAAIDPFDGSTVYELAEIAELNAHAIGKRMKELETKGLVYTEGERSGPSGRMCRVWYLKK